MKGGTYVNDAFPRIITLLRKERGLSQKKAAEELQVSQALLSHYEKGIRKCGLEFVVKLQTSITYPVITYWEDLQTVQVPPSQ